MSKEQLTLQELETIKMHLSSSIYYDALVEKIGRIIEQHPITHIDLIIEDQ